MPGVGIRLEDQHPERRGRRVQVPGVVQHLQVVQDAPGVALEGAVGQREGAMQRRVAQHERDVGVIKDDIRETPGQLVEDGRLAGGAGCLQRQHRDIFTRKKLAPAGDEGFQLGPEALREAGQLAQALERRGGVKGDREVLRQPVAQPVLADEPHHQAAFGAGVQVQQPAAMRDQGSGFVFMFVWGAGRDGQQLLDQVAQAQDFLVLLEQHGEQEGLERQGMRGIGGGGQVLLGGGEEAVQRQLVAAAQRAPEAGEFRLFLQEGLGDGWQGASHVTPGKGLAGG